MKKVLLSAIITVSSLSFVFAHNDDGGAFLIKLNENVAKVTMQETEVVHTTFNDDTFKYVREKRDLIGYALQLASFSDLGLAKEYALKIVQKGDAEKRQLFIYTVSNPEKTYYKVYFGLLKTDELAREKQRTFLSLGYSPFVKEFR